MKIGSRKGATIIILFLLGVSPVRLAAQYYSEGNDRNIALSLNLLSLVNGYASMDFQVRLNHQLSYYLRPLFYNSFTDLLLYTGMENNGISSYGEFRVGAATGLVYWPDKMFSGFAFGSGIMTTIDTVSFLANGNLYSAAWISPGLELTGEHRWIFFDKLTLGIGVVFGYRFFLPSDGDISSFLLNEIFSHYERRPFTFAINGAIGLTFSTG